MSDRRPDPLYVVADLDAPRTCRLVTFDERAAQRFFWVVRRRPGAPGTPIATRAGERVWFPPPGESW